ncbi:hypothetical protein GCM10011428_51900 [Streptomyces violaceus]
MIKNRGLDALCVWGPGHGGPSVLANSWLEGSYTEKYPDATRDAPGMELLMRQFSFPGGVPSHAARESPARSTKAANSATPSPTPTAPPSTTRACWSPA